MSAIENGDFETGVLSPWNDISYLGTAVVDAPSALHGVYGLHESASNPRGGGDYSVGGVVQNIGAVSIGDVIDFSYKVAAADLENYALLQVYLTAEEGGQVLLQVDDPVPGEKIDVHAVIDFESPLVLLYVYTIITPGGGIGTDTLEAYYDYFRYTPREPEPGPTCGTITFGFDPPITLTRPSPNEPITEVRQTTRVTLSGAQRVISPPNFGRSWVFTCWPESQDEIDALKALIGWSYGLDLVICGHIWDNIYITGFSEREVTPAQLEYTVEFTQDSGSGYVNYAIGDQGIRVFQKLGDAYRSISMSLVGFDRPTKFENFEVEMSSEGHDATVFHGFTLPATKQWRPADRSQEVRGMDQAWYLGRQDGSFELLKAWPDFPDPGPGYPEVSEETDPQELILRILGHDPLGTEYLTWTGIVPYRITTPGGMPGWGTTIPYNMFTVDENTKVKQTIDAICDHCGWIFLVKIGPVTDIGGRPLPCAYFCSYGNIDDPDQGLDLPALVSIDYSDGLVEDVDEEDRADEYINQVIVYGTTVDPATGVWVRGEAHTVGVEEETEIRITLSVKRSDVTTAEQANAIAAQLLDIVTDPPALYSFTTMDLIDLEFLQKIKLTGFDDIPDDDMRIISVEYVKQLQGTYAKVQCVKDTDFTSQLAYKMLVQDSVSASKAAALQVVKEKVPETLAGTLETIDGDIGTATSDKDGRIVKVQIIGA